MHARGIAIIDDDVGFVEALSELVSLAPDLSILGTAGTFADGIVVLSRGGMSLGIVDTNLPDGSGLDLVLLARRRGVHATLVVVSQEIASPPRSWLENADALFIPKTELDLDVVVSLAERYP